MFSMRTLIRTWPGCSAWPPASRSAPPGWYVGWLGAAVRGPALPAVPAHPARQGRPTRHLGWRAVAAAPSSSRAAEAGQGDGPGGPDLGLVTDGRLQPHGVVQVVQGTGELPGLDADQATLHEGLHGV